jgi:hypothetical protein
MQKLMQRRFLPLAFSYSVSTRSVPPRLIPRAQLRHETTKITPVEDMTVPLDTFRFVSRLEAAGFTREQSESVLSSVVSVLDATFVVLVAHWSYKRAKDLAAETQSQLDQHKVRGFPPHGTHARLTDCTRWISRNSRPIFKCWNAMILLQSRRTMNG